VRIDERLLFDGRVADNTPISQAVALGTDHNYVLPAGVVCALETSPPTATESS
jgi:NTE family protein